MAVSILGISAYRHDSAAVLVRDGEIVAAAQEERFTRKKFDARFPWHAARWCLAGAGLPLAEVDYIAVHDTSLPDSMLCGDLQALAAASVGDFRGRGLAPPPLLCSQHHRSHAASAFLPSPFRRAAVICVDGLGESATTSIWLGENNRLTTQWEIGFPHSLGLLYSAFTHYCGFKVNSGEYKLMGLAPYGEPRYVELILHRLIEVDDDGTFRLNMAYFDVAGGLPKTNERFRKVVRRAGAPA